MPKNLDKSHSLDKVQKYMSHNRIRLPGNQKRKNANKSTRVGSQLQGPQANRENEDQILIIYILPCPKIFSNILAKNVMKNESRGK